MHFIFLAAILLLVGCWSGEKSMNDLVPPIAQQREKILSIHGHDRVDEYYWIRDDNRADPAVLKLLADENAYTKAVMAHSEQLQS